MTPTYLIRDPEILKHISIKEFDSFEDHKFIIDPEVDSLFGQTLFLMKGEHSKTIVLLELFNIPNSFYNER